MGIGSSKSKRTNPCSSWQGVAHTVPLCLPLSILLNDVERAPFQLDVRIELFTMQTLHQLFMLQLQQHFNHTCNTSGQFQMSNVAFYRANPTPCRRRWSLAAGNGAVGVVPCADP